MLNGPWVHEAGTGKIRCGEGRDASCTVPQPYRALRQGRQSKASPSLSPPPPDDARLILGTPHWPVVHDVIPNFINFPRFTPELMFFHLESPEQQLQPAGRSRADVCTKAVAAAFRRAPSSRRTGARPRVSRERLRRIPASTASPRRPWALAQWPGYFLQVAAHSWGP